MMEGWTYKILDIDLTQKTIEEKPLDKEMANH
jgi:aldehyde:ferredoxin oxidoreductase